ncbi:MAG: molybdate ABC transporter permease subunit [Phycisphaerales bacterium]|nr:molybdate ABC transporter permease subunit [Phycisphaerae bacterium]NNF42991.1 molybdate ABC transporter permease subunit [Phycisphaerales bacterium]NNM25388.1 molybdate ABC transporter permease subunit [Phycisphaerales bacterium]
MLGEAEWAAVRLSAVVAAWALLISAPPGIALGWLLARKRFWGKSLLDAVVHLPLVLPPVVTGYVLLMLLGRQGIGEWLEEVGIPIAFTQRAAVLAAAVMGFPLLVRAVRLGIELVDRRVEDAAATLGASPWRVFLTVTTPLALPGILTGCVLAFARSLGEFGATITFASNIAGETRTLPLAIFSFSQVPGGDAAAIRLVVISVVLSLAALLVSEVLARRVSSRLGHR